MEKNNTAGESAWNELCSRVTASMDTGLFPDRRSAMRYVVEQNPDLAKVAIVPATGGQTAAAHFGSHHQHAPGTPPEGQDGFSRLIEKAQTSPIVRAAQKLARTNT